MLYVCLQTDTFSVPFYSNLDNFVRFLILASTQMRPTFLHNVLCRLIIQFWQHCETIMCSCYLCNEYFHFSPKCILMIIIRALNIWNLSVNIRYFHSSLKSFGKEQIWASRHTEVFSNSSYWENALTEKAMRIVFEQFKCADWKHDQLTSLATCSTEKTDTH
jgi:hypothetical protein